MVWLKSYDEEYVGLLRHLTDHWEMEPYYAKAFLGTYKKSIGKMLAKGRARSERLRNSLDPEASLMAFTLAADEDLALVGQAYQAYMSDLRRGRHIGTDVEKAIWAILVNRSDLVSDLDKGFGNYIAENHEQEFPRLLDEVFTRFDENPRGSTREPDLAFAGTYPDSESCTPVRLKYGDFVISYYENPKTIGEKVGVPPAYTYPHVAVVTAPGKTEYELIVRVEDGGISHPHALLTGRHWSSQ